jgi:very-short-patch-repair endonuclease
MNFKEIFEDRSDEIRNCIKDEIIYLSVYDILKIIGCINPRQAFSGLKQKYSETKQLNITMFKFPGKGQKFTPILEEKSITTLIELSLASKQFSSDTKKKWLEKIKSNYVLFMAIQTEAELICIIQKSFRNHETIKHYYVKPYNLDLYFLKEKIAVECDERNHVSYDKDKEEERKIYITKKLDCLWIRFDPYNKRFNIGNVIADIMEIIMKQLHI